AACRNGNHRCGDRRSEPGAVSAAAPRCGPGTATIAVALAIDDPELAERMRSIVTRQAGLELAEADRIRSPDIPIRHSITRERNAPLILLGDGVNVAEALRAGVSAVLSESCSAEALNAAICAVLRGLTTLSPRFREQLVERQPGEVDPGEEGTEEAGQA